MRRTLLVLTVLFVLYSTSGFVSPRQVAGAALEVLDRSGQPATRITDGDTVSLRLTLPALRLQSSDIHLQAR